MAGCKQRFGQVDRHAVVTVEPLPRLRDGHAMHDRDALDRVLTISATRKGGGGRAEDPQDVAALQDVARSLGCRRVCVSGADQARENCFRDGVANGAGPLQWFLTPAV